MLVDRFLYSIGFVLALIVLISVGPPLSYADALPSVPKVKLQPILVLRESNGWGSFSGPWPYGLRLVVYEDGQVIFSPDPEEQLPDRTPRYFQAKLAPAAARKMADDAIAALAGVPEIMRGDDSVTDMGWTTILVWRDGVLEAPRNAYAHPCKADSRDFEPDSYQAQNRAGTDRRFLDLCDRLSAFSPEGATTWQPLQLVIQLQRGDGEKRAEWPADWGPQPTPDAAGKPLCVDLSQPRSRVTDLLLSDKRAERESAFLLAVLKAPHWWEIGRWQYPLPGEIAMKREGYSPWPIFEGGCDSDN